MMTFFFEYKNAMISVIKEVKLSEHGRHSFRASVDQEMKESVTSSAN